MSTKLKLFHIYEYRTGDDAYILPVEYIGDEDVLGYVIGEDLDKGHARDSIRFSPDELTMAVDHNFRDVLYQLVKAKETERGST